MLNRTGGYLTDRTNRALAYRNQLEQSKKNRPQCGGPRGPYMLDTYAKHVGDLLHNSLCRTHTGRDNDLGMVDGAALFPCERNVAGQELHVPSHQLKIA